jgi:hypothetical protein
MRVKVTRLVVFEGELEAVVHQLQHSLNGTKTIPRREYGRPASGGLTITTKILSVEPREAEEEVLQVFFASEAEQAEAEVQLQAQERARRN